MTELQIKYIKNWAEVVAPKLPAVRLKGTNHDDRVRLSKLVGNKAGKVFALIPFPHAQKVCISRNGGYSSDVMFVSEPAANMIRLAMTV